MNCLDLTLTNGFSKGRWLVFMDPGLQSFVYKQLDKIVHSSLRVIGATFEGAGFQGGRGCFGWAYQLKNFANRNCWKPFGIRISVRVRAS
jgi:hypothetical protein